MTTIFLSGSRNISHLDKDVQRRLQNIIDQKFSVVVGDANGIDKAVQQFFFEAGYKEITVYCSGSHCRNNIGRWKTKNISVSPKLKGRDFYTEKDKSMALDADYGFVLWDGKSQGSITNVMELIKNNKKALVYYSPQKTFYKITDANDASKLISNCSQDLINKLQAKLAVNLKEKSEVQVSFGF